MLEKKDFNFAFCFDREGFYSGLVRRDSNGFLPSNSTMVEPAWQEGFLPKWDFSDSSWKLVPRELKGEVVHLSEWLGCRDDLMLSRVESAVHKREVELGEKLFNLRKMQAQLEVKIDLLDRQLFDVFALLKQSAVVAQHDKLELARVVRESSFKVWVVGVWQRFIKLF